MSIDTFIAKECIDSGKEITIPENAQYIRARKGHVFFFSGKNGSKRITEIRENSSIICFPDYRKNIYHISYGLPVFKQK